MESKTVNKVLCSIESEMKAIIAESLTNFLQGKYECRDSYEQLQSETYMEILGKFASLTGIDFEVEDVSAAIEDQVCIAANEWMSDLQNEMIATIKKYK